MTAVLFLAAAQAMTFSADRMAADNVTKSLAATGHIVAVAGPVTMRGEALNRAADGTMHFHDPTCVTTCSNAIGHTHWNITGELKYKEDDYVLVKNAWLNFYEIPVLWLPYMYYSLDSDCGFSWMPGYVGRWGAYLLTRYAYNIAGDEMHRDDTYWLAGATRFDLRYKQGIAAGEDLEWNLGDFGAGAFQVYYAWDVDAKDRYDQMGPNYLNEYHNWGSDVSENRYVISMKHQWEASERDKINVRASYYSDSYFQFDFMRKSLFSLKGEWLSYQNSGVFWEHMEDSFAFGAEASGRLNDFYGMIGRLPEIYFDVNPMPILDTPFNYESATRIGYLTRGYAEYGGVRKNGFSYNPGPWAEYDAWRIDSYHRFTAPFRIANDAISVVPRLAYRATWWSQSGETDTTGRSAAQNAGALFRSIGEFGATFAGRGVAWIDDDWQHMVEPYFDLLAQQAWFTGIDGQNRPYVFDNLDASMTWEDQFAGRSRNLPYSYYGITPGLRNAWSVLTEHGGLRQVIDVDAYVVAQFNTTDYIGDNDVHKLAEAGKPNYGKNGCELVPGVRVRWTPTNDIALGFRAEYNSDDNCIAYASANLKHKISDDFSYYFKYDLRDQRYWDFSSSPFDASTMREDVLGLSRLQIAEIGFEHNICDWLAWGPRLRWDIRQNELDSVGAWIDYMTDCLGFRLIVEYDNDFTTIDGYEWEDDWSVGFYIYLRAFGAGSGNPLN